ncbi:MAG TPA: glycosyltransferase [Chloroflexi bacterium]|nr:glycosyltransferase [Chloroflexota bacterium]
MSTVSVVIPAYNQGHFLGEAIESVLAQTHPDFEILVVDDGSTDDTAVVAQSYTDPRVRYIYKENGGLSSARNAGLRQAAGEYISYLDSDDCFLPAKLARLVGELEANPQVGLVAGQALLMDEHGRQLNKKFDRSLPENPVELLLVNPLHVGSVLLRREWQEKVGFFDETLRSYEDWDMWLRLALAGCRMRYVPEPVSLYRFHSAQMTRDGRQMTTATFAVLDKLFHEFTLPDEWQAMRGKAYSRAHLRGAAQAYHAGVYAEGQEHLAQAVALDPDLLAEDGQKLADTIAAWTNLPKIADPLNYLETVYDNLTPELTLLARRRNRDLSQAAMAAAFKAYNRGDKRQARTAVRRAIRYQPAWLKNRGVLSIFLRTHLSPS